MTHAERCKLATDCLPKAEYRARLDQLHAEMLTEIDRLQAAITRACAGYPAGDDCVPTCVAVLREAMAPSVGAQADRGVRPVAQVQRMGSFQGVPHYGCLLNLEAEHRMKVNDPLYGQAELDAAVSLERERCAALVQANADACEPGSMLQVYLASNAAALRA